LCETGGQIWQALQDVIFYTGTEEARFFKASRAFFMITN